MRNVLNWQRLGAAAMISTALASCSSDSGDGGAGPTGSIQVSVSPTAVTIQQGMSGTLTLTLVRGGGFSAAVNVSVEGLPAGITGSVAPSTLTGTTTSAIVTVNVAASMAAGSYAATVRASAPGVGDATASYTVNVTAAPALAIALSPAALSLEQGSSGTSTVTLTRTNFDGAVALSMDAPPAGITAAFAPASVTGTTSTLTVSVGGSVAAGTYPLVVRASGTGVTDRTAALALTVTAAPNVVLSVQPAVITVQQGASGTATVTLTRTAFTGAVTLTLAAPPSGVTGIFTPAAPTGVTSTLTLSVGSQVAPGQYTLTIQGTSTLGVRQVSLGLTVTASVPGNVEVRFCSASENPVFFAYQDGAGAWVPVTATLSSGVYRYVFPLTQGYGGVFFVTPSGQGPAVFETTVLHASTAEMTTLGLENCQSSGPTRSVWLQVSGVGNGQMANLSLGNQTEVFFGGLTPSPIQFTDVRSGLVDFIGVRSSVLTGVPDKIQDVRGLDPADGSTLPFIADFNNVTGYDPASAQLVIGNALGDDLVNATSFLTTNGEAGLLGGFKAPSTAVTRTWYGVPTAKLQAGDIHMNFVVATPAVTSTDEMRSFVGFVTTVQDVSPLLGPRLPTPVVTSVGVPAYRRLSVQGTIPAEYADFVSAEFGPSGGGNEVFISRTGAYLAATTSSWSYDIVMPDLTGLAGFPMTSGLPAGELEATITVAGWTGAGIIAAVPATGATALSASKTVKIVVP